MFLHGVPLLDYADPWALGADARLAQLCRPGRIRIAYYYDHPDGSTFRYRCYNMAQVINARMPEATASWFFQADEAAVLDRMAEAADVLVIARARYSERLNRMITRARQLGRRVIYDVDDLVFSIDHVHLLMNSLDQELTEAKWMYWFGYVGRLAAVLHLCQRAITTNDFLAARLRELGPVADARVVPNFLNREQMAVSGRIMAAKRANGFARDGRLHLGYFSGSPSHARDFEIVAGSLAALLRRHPHLVLRLAGYLQVPAVLEPYPDRIERLPMQDFCNLQRAIGESEINLVPLQENVFTHCKSELKFFEAGIVGTLTLASPCHAFRQAIRDGENGYLVRAMDWEERLDSVIGRMDAYPALAEAAFLSSREHYSWEHQVAAIRRAVLED